MQPNESGAQFGYTEFIDNESQTIRTSGKSTADTAGEPVHLFASYRNHAQFYESIAEYERSLGRVVKIHWLEDSRSVTGILRKGIRGLLRDAARSKDTPLRVYLEEYYGLGDLIFIYLFSLAHRNLRISLCLHNLNKWFLLEYRPSLRRLATHAAAAKLTGRSSEIIVTSDSLRSYAEHLSKFTQSVRVVPFSARPADVTPFEGGAGPSFAIPGNVDETRRDYPIVFEACRRLAREGCNFRLVLLCRLKRSKLSAGLAAIIESFEADFPGVLIVFDQFIPDRDYQRHIASSTALIANVVPYFKGDFGTTETYGISKESATRAWADSYDKPCLIPHEMRAGVRAQNYHRYGDADELYEMLSQFAGRGH